jgi:hypothetical protein
MRSPIKHAWMLLIALPVAALADPVSVTTHSTGTTYLDDTVLAAMGLQTTASATELPYELTLTSTYDWSGPLPARGIWATQSDSEVVIDFRVGTMHYHYAGIASSSAVLYTPFSNSGDGYQHEIWLAQEPYDALNFVNRGIGPTGSLGPGGALTPLDVDSASVDGQYGISAYHSNDEYTFSWNMFADASTLSVQVASPVPEPAPFALLATGLLALGLRRRLGRSVRQLQAIRHGGTSSASASTR